VRRCQHGIYWPEGHAIAFSCQSCNPIINEEPTIAPASAPIMMERSPLRDRVNGPVPVCADCGVTSTRTSTECIGCGKKLPSASGLRQRANRREPGECPDCGSRVHFETKDKKQWECADCGTTYPASRQRRNDGIQP